MEKEYLIPRLPLSIDLETIEILKQLNNANRQLAELKGVAQSIPNEVILINTLTLQEAKDSSAVENIVTTHDDLYMADLNMKGLVMSAGVKEVLNYKSALQCGFSLVRKDKLLTNYTIKRIQEELEGNNAGFRTVPGTSLKNSKGETVYIPPQDKVSIEEYMYNLQEFINDAKVSDLDPLIKMAVIHHQFESIHPFYDGNGRTGRIISILYMVASGLLELPILYLSRYITENKAEYYRLLQAIRDNENNERNWQDWVLFNLKGVEITSINTIVVVKNVSRLMQEYKQILRPLFGKAYKHELLNNLFFHPYTKIDFMCKDLQVQRKTATKYLDMIEQQGLLKKVKVGTTNYYVNIKLFDLFLNQNHLRVHEEESIESIHNP